MGIKMKDIPFSDRPREKAKRYGISSLKDEELLGLIFRTGTRGYNAVELGKETLKIHNNLYYLSKEDYYGLKEIKGLDEAKICTLEAVFEIAKRIDEIKKGRIDKISDIESLAEHYSYLGDLSQEELILLVLDRTKRVIKEKTLYVGTIDSLNINFKDVLFNASIPQASYLVLIHNHPSGKLYPSDDDIVTTGLIKEKCASFGIKLYDHLIISKEGYYSFLETNKLSNL